MNNLSLVVRFLPPIIALVIAVSLVLGSTTAKADAETLLKEQCGACHNLMGPAPTALKEMWARKGPDLFYAGNKYRAEWMKQWLQKPTRIRPAGMFYGDHVKPSDNGDMIDASSLTGHPVLSAADAGEATEALMQRKALSNLIHAGEYQPGSISKSMGEMMFDKFRGCLACHEIEPGYGGLSGPEVYTAASRLQDDYLISYMRNPQAWDPKSFMPNRHLTDMDLQKFVHYFHQLGQEAKP